MSTVPPFYAPKLLPRFHSHSIEPVRAPVHSGVLLVRRCNLTHEVVTVRSRGKRGFAVARTRQLREVENGGSVHSLRETALVRFTQR
jgi:hypothetical protein